MMNEPRNMNLVGAQIKEGQILERPPEQPQISSSSVTEGQWRADEKVDEARWKELGDKVLGEKFINENEKFIPELQTDLPRPHGDKLLEHKKQ